jgi:hypothetical protein
MPTHSHAIVWIDHRNAKVIFFNALEDSETSVRADEPATHIHTKAGSASGTHLHGDKSHFDAVARDLAPALYFVVVGPSAAKEEFAAYLGDNHPELAKRLIGVEPLDKESDRQLLAFARRYFRSKDRMTPQRLDA